MSARSVSFYDRLAVLYPIVDFFLKIQKRRLFREINSCAEGELLEIGVGNGSHLSWYQKHKVTGIDTSAEMLDRAKRRNTNTTLILMNGETLAFLDESFDYVVLSHVITVVDDPEKLLGEVYRVLKPNGQVFILNHFTPTNWLRFVDKSFESLSKILCFRSVFGMSSIRRLEQFKLMQEYNAGFFNYFKIVVYEKNL